MNDLIAVIAICIFFVSSYLVYDLFTNGFNVHVLLGAMLGFTLVHFMWPKSRKGENSWYEAVEFIFELPYKAIAFLLRSAFSKSGKSDLDIDV